MSSVRPQSHVEASSEVARESTIRLRETTSGAQSSSTRPDDVGILAIEVYFPRSKVDQLALEEYDGVDTGKYTVGLGQRAMAFTDDREDVVSLSMTVVHSLLEKYCVQPHEIGRLEVGTESSVDRSKSVKSFLMSLFSQSGNSDVQGVDCINACYGGTAALFNAVNWVESRSWDGRYAVVVAADVAIYATGPARASGGCGAVAMLIGPNAPLVLEPGLSAAYMDNVYDFYKPSGVFPQVEGKLSISCYLTALDRCYARLCHKAERRGQAGAATPGQPFSLGDVDFCVMHAPFARMVRKGFARLYLQDTVRRRQAVAASGRKCEAARDSAKTPAEPRVPQPTVELRADSRGAGSAQLDRCFAPQQPDNNDAEGALDRLLRERGEAAASDVSDKDIERAAMQASSRDFERMAAPGLLLGCECGNMYAASVHASLASLVFNKGAQLEGRRILSNSFGSGLAASIFCIRGTARAGRFSLTNIASQLDLNARLAARTTATPAEFTAALDALERAHGRADFKPAGAGQPLFLGTYALREVDARFRRLYCRVPTPAR